MNYTIPDIDSKCCCILRFIALAGMLVLLTAVSGLAGDQADNDMAIRSITPMVHTENQIADYSFEDFDLLGPLNKVSGNQVIIGNSTVTLADGVSTSGISLQNTVGAILNEAGEVVLLILIYNEPN